MSLSRWLMRLRRIVDAMLPGPIDYPPHDRAEVWKW